MNIIEELKRKPWLPEQAEIDNLHEGSAYALPTAKLGLRVFLTAVTVLLSLFVIAYSDRMAVSDWRPLPEPWLLWLNTAVLILSSVSLQRSLNAARAGRAADMRAGLLAGGGLAVLFLVGQLWAWQQLIALGYFATANPAYAFFYLLTALHGIHLLGGLVAWGRIMRKIQRQVDMEQMCESVELCTIYWHFLLAVWLVFFSLLLFT